MKLHALVERARVTKQDCQLMISWTRTCSYDLSTSCFLNEILLILWRLQESRCKYLASRYMSQLHFAATESRSLIVNIDVRSDAAMAQWIDLFVRNDCHTIVQGRL